MARFGQFRYSYILVNAPTAVFRSVTEFSCGLKRLRAMGYAGVEFPLAQPPGFDLAEMQAAAAEA